MLVSRFWFVFLSVVLGAAVSMVFLATRMFDRASTRTMGEALAGDSQVVASYLRDDARKRSIALMVAAFDDDMRVSLAKASGAVEKVPTEVRDKVKTALRKQYSAVPADQKFDAMFAVDQTGRVVAQVGFDDISAADAFELGGYPVVADALHGWVRDDAWVLGSRIFRVVARPVEHDLASMPAGAIVGMRAIDDSFARELSRRTGSAVGFYANGARVSSGAPEGFDVAQLDTITGDLKSLESDPSYREKGFSDVRLISESLGVVYARVVGEAWDLGAGYAVARTARALGGPMGLLRQFDDKDKQSVPLWIPILIALIGAGVGIGLTFVEHTLPLRVFQTESERFAKAEIDQLVPSRFRGAYRKVAALINDGVDKIAAKGGVPRKAADLQQVLGPMPSKPAMSAFGGPQDATPAVKPPAPQPAFAPASPQVIATSDDGAVVSSAPPLTSAAPIAPPPAAPAAVAPAPKSTKAAMPAPRPGLAGPPPATSPPGSDMGGVPSMVEPDGDDEATVVSHVPSEIMAQFGRDTARPPAQPSELTEWQQTYEEYLRIRQECSESIDGITFEKFQKTLKRNRDQLVERHACKNVRFSVYVKDGHAAIKANPVRD